MLHRILFPALLALLAQPLTAQTGWTTLGRFLTSSNPSFLATDGVHVLGSDAFASPTATVFRYEAGALVDQQFLGKSISPSIGWGPGAVADGWCALAWSSGGLVDLFEETATGWVLRQTLSDPTVGGGYGEALAFGPGTLVVGDSASAAGEASEVHVYSLSAGTWTLAQTLDGPGSASVDDGFGRALALDGARLAVGAPLWRGVGSAFVYERSSGAFVGVREIEGSNMDFGAALALRADVLLVGAGRTHGLPGTVQFFERNVEGSWRLVHELEDPDGTSFSQFGSSLALGPGVAAVAAPHAPGLGDAKIYLFHRLGSRWVRSGTAVARPTRTRLGAGMAFVRQELIATADALLNFGEISLFGPSFVLSSPAARPATSR